MAELRLQGAPNDEAVKLEQGVLYRFTYRGLPDLLLVLCPCGCGDVVSLNISHRRDGDQFHPHCDNGRPTLDHPVRNGGPCGTCFSITNGELTMHTKPREQTSWSYSIDQLEAMKSGSWILDTEGRDYEKRGRAWYHGDSQASCRQLAQLRYTWAIEPADSKETP